MVMYIESCLIQMTAQELEMHVSIHGLEHLEIIADVLKLFKKHVQPVAASSGVGQDSTSAGDRLLSRQPDVTQPLEFNTQVI